MQLAVSGGILLLLIEFSILLQLFPHLVAAIREHHVTTSGSGWHAWTARRQQRH